MTKTYIILAVLSSIRIFILQVKASILKQPYIVQDVTMANLIQDGDFMINQVFIPMYLTSKTSLVKEINNVLQKFLLKHF